MGTKCCLIKSNHSYFIKHYDVLTGFDITAFVLTQLKLNRVIDTNKDRPKTSNWQNEQDSDPSFTMFY